MKIDQTAAMALIEAGLKEGNIQGAVATAFEELLDQARRGAPLKNGALPYRCWVLTDWATDAELPNGAHFGLREHAEKIRQTYHPLEVRKNIRIVQRETPCVLLVCGCCGLVYDDTEVVDQLGPDGEPEVGGCVHHPSREAADEAGREAGWVRLYSAGPWCQRCANQDCPCAGRRDYVELMIGSKKLIKNHLSPEFEKLRAVERQIRALFDKVGEASAESDVPLGVMHRDAEEELDRILAACRSLERMVIVYDDDLARELTSYTGCPHGRLRDPEETGEPPF